MERKKLDQRRLSISTFPSAVINAMARLDVKKKLLKDMRWWLRNDDKRNGTGDNATQFHSRAPRLSRLRAEVSAFVLKRAS